MPREPSVCGVSVCCVSVLLYRFIFSKGTYASRLHRSSHSMGRRARSQKVKKSPLHPARVGAPHTHPHAHQHVPALARTDHAASLARPSPSRSLSIVLSRLSTRFSQGTYQAAVTSSSSSVCTAQRGTSIPPDQNAPTRQHKQRDTTHELHTRHDTTRHDQLSGSHHALMLIS